MSVLYETAEDLEREEGVARYCMELFGWHHLEKLDPLEFVDRCIWMEDKNIYGWAEIKTRTYSYDRLSSKRFKYPGTYMIDVRKVDAGLTLARDWEKHYFLIVGLTDGIYLNRVTKTGHYIQDWGGRTDRNDPLDKDWCYYIPLSEFRRI